MLIWTSIGKEVREGGEKNILTATWRNDIYICIKRNDVTSSQDIEEIKKYEVKIKNKMKTTDKKIENI